jgi:hypothetical protein
MVYWRLLQRSLPYSLRARARLDTTRGGLRKVARERAHAYG